MKNGFYLSLSQASKETGKSKSLLSKALKNGKLSYIERDASGYKIDPSELFRIYPKAVLENVQKEQNRTGGDSTENAYLKRENELLRESVIDLRSRLDSAESERVKLMQMLTHQPTQSQTQQGSFELFNKIFKNWKKET